ncbi:MAG: N-formylglutamate amidohydrolase [Shimia sp.]|uniref:N-formylglutamate amidohydrolase n=1 Tax=Shimia sp. TaxID=1954381 RepID=UPI004058B022
MTKSQPKDQAGPSKDFSSVETIAGCSSVVLVCEHASRFIPAEFGTLGLDDAARQSHVAWDPGALAVAERMATLLDATLVAGKVSRLIYDCNRPPHAPDAMPEHSEVFDISGNADLSTADRERRVEAIYAPFKESLQHAVAGVKAPVIVTIHSFTPVYHGARRSVEIGILHDTDGRLADAMLTLAPKYTQANTQRNQPYGPENGVTHTLKEHAIPAGHLNVMLEIRNDLIESQSQQSDIATQLAAWVAEACAVAGAEGLVQCKA